MSTQQLNTQGLQLAAADLAAVSLPVCVVDDGATVLWANDEFRRLVRQEQPDFVAAALRELAANPAGAARVHQREVGLEDEAGEKREYLLTIEPRADSASWFCYLFDISHVRRAERASRKQLRVEKLLTGVLSYFVGEADQRQAINSALLDLGLFTRADRALVVVVDEESNCFHDAFEWIADDQTASADHLVGQSVKVFPWWHRELDRNDLVDIGDVSVLPPQAREEMSRIGVTPRGSVLLMPLLADSRFAGLLALTCTRPQALNKPEYVVILDLMRHFLERIIHLQRNDAALQRSVQELHEKQSQLIRSERMASIGQIAAGVAHEINNPIGYITANLTTLQGYAPTLRTALDVCLASPDAGGIEAEEGRFILDDLDGIIAESLEGCGRVRDIVQNLRGFARADGTRPVEANLNDCIESTLKIVWNELKYRCRVVREFGELPSLSCFPGQINQVVMNLLVNAAQAIEGEGTITIATRADPGEIVLSITDTGVGVPVADQARIFEPFFTTKPPGKGTGLGLYICREIIAGHHGSLTVASVPGAGTTLTVRLPLPGLEVDDA
jgi:signal transduction histidine kinase